MPSLLPHLAAEERTDWWRVTFFPSVSSLLLFVFSSLPPLLLPPLSLLPVVFLRPPLLCLPSLLLLPLLFFLLFVLSVLFFLPLSPLPLSR